LGPEEACNGDMARRAGNEYLAQTLIQQNVETLNGYHPKRILAPDVRTAYNVLKNEYHPVRRGTYPVVSHAELLFDLAQAGTPEAQRQSYGKPDLSRFMLPEPLERRPAATPRPAYGP
jgi:Fe-S oxidoreductase